MLKKIFAFLFIVISVNISIAQKFPGWQVYTSMRQLTGIDVKNNTVWAATTGGLFSFDVNNISNINKYTNLEGLRNNQLSSVFIDNNGNVWAGDAEGAISVYNPVSKSWRYIIDVKQSSQTSKQINDIFQYGNEVFIANAFSIIRFNIGLFQFVDQPYIYLGSLPVNPYVNENIVVNDTIWAAAQSGIAFADIRTNLPIQTNWRSFTTNNSPLRTNIINTVVSFNNRVYFGTDSEMVYYDYNTSNLIRYSPLYNGVPVTEGVVEMTVNNNSLYFATRTNNVYRVDVSNKNNAELVMQNVPVTAMKGDGQNIFYGTSDRGALKNNKTNPILPNGPYTNFFFDLSVDRNSNLWVASGGFGIYRYNGTTWKNFTVQEYPIMGGNNYVSIYNSKYNDVTWSGSSGNGLLKITGDNLFRYTDTNSCLQHFLNEGFVLVEGISEDNSQNLWMINRATDRPILNFKEVASQCLAYPVPDNPGQNTLIHMAIDNYNTKWMTFPSDIPQGQTGIVYFNEGSQTGKIIPASLLGQDITTANHITVDKNGEVWIATDNGVAIIADPYQVIANPNTIPFIQKMRIIANGLSTPLTENVRVICVDAINNKWLGTKASGVLYLSPDGSTILNQYNITNSPIPDNEITTIAADNKTGKIYFGNSRGLSSYQSIAVEPLTDCSQITAGPNPFLIPNDRLLRIDGLVEGSTVKILTISGLLVNEFESPGGRLANWDGKDLNGNYVSTGIYIIAGFNKDGSKVCTGKVAIVRK